MSKAEERGKIYALHKASEKLNDYYGSAMLSVVQFDGYDIKNAYIECYHQAEKDLELTWEDMMLIHRCIKDAMNYHLYKMMEGMDGQKIVYQDVLKRYKDYKERK